jgi:hypothetical protein
VVWDFGSDKPIVSWKPRTQRVNAYPNRQTRFDYQFAISPDGEYIVEGGAGSLSLYRIVP